MNHPALDAIMATRAESKLPAEQVARVPIPSIPFGLRMTEAAPASMLGAKFSIPYAAAAALVLGRTDVAAFEESRLADPRIRDLAARVEVAADPEMTLKRADYPTAEVRITLADGRVLSSRAKPIVGIADSGSGFNNCHRQLPELIESVKRGVLAAGGLPITFPTISLGEVFLDPTSMMYRNLMSMDVEEMVRAQPMDAVVLVGGCDKTVPAQLMGAASAGVPAIQLVAGPMMTGRWQNERLGACTDCRRFWARYRAGGISKDEIDGVESRVATTAGARRVMGAARPQARRGET